MPDTMRSQYTTLRHEGRKWCLEKRAIFVDFPRDDLRPVAGLLDHLICQEQQGWRHRDPQRPSGLEVDHQLELHRLLHGQSLWLGAFEDLVHVDGGPAVILRVALAI